ncbi:hypothetical protein RO3G_10961 [Rhizopus delemar RA 99-880]|uniref:Uncharacterized protein n=1 Tax=Rhizopus delemar (strain RA 99-880 / ATCC MYA-4621 / FGSC 9543 / NRRL 43880) TaxID=246409 RepID=I1CCS0_RHIO9|nr:hypothetical protein RO3G_10961 [Rhizopus delemar RA 99-880]|eukprot:EIE86250.1 hypothetical protein RO3G_10961 [Rhizopus delemar RA 99-880]
MSVFVELVSSLVFLPKDIRMDTLRLLNKVFFTRLSVVPYAVQFPYLHV